DTRFLACDSAWQTRRRGTAPSCFVSPERRLLLVPVGPLVRATHQSASIVRIAVVLTVNASTCVPAACSIVLAAVVLTVAVAALTRMRRSVGLLMMGCVCKCERA